MSLVFCCCFFGLLSAAAAPLNACVAPSVQTEDARAALLLYRQEYKEWEAFMTKRYGKGQGKKGKGKASV